jgi:hypothetical protein
MNGCNVDDESGEYWWVGLSFTMDEPLFWEKTDLFKALDFRIPFFKSLLKHKSQT